MKLKYKLSAAVVAALMAVSSVAVNAAEIANSVYTDSKAAVDGGTVSVQQSDFAYGDTVNVDVTPSTDYTIERIEVLNADGAVVSCKYFEAESVQPDTYSFELKVEEGTTVNAYFISAKYAVARNIATVCDAYTGTVTVGEGADAKTYNRIIAFATIQGVHKDKGFMFIQTGAAVADEDFIYGAPDVASYASDKEPTKANRQFAINLYGDAVKTGIYWYRPYMSYYNTDGELVYKYGESKWAEVKGEQPVVEEPVVENATEEPAIEEPAVEENTETVEQPDEITEEVDEPETPAGTETPAEIDEVAEDAEGGLQ